MGTRQFYRRFRTSPDVPGRYRASYRRLQTLRMRDNWAPQMWWVIVALIVAAVLALTGVIEHPPHH